MKFWFFLALAIAFGMMVLSVVVWWAAYIIAIGLVAALIWLVLQIWRERHLVD